MRRRTVLRLVGVVAVVATLIILALPVLGDDKDFAVFEPDDERLPSDLRRPGRRGLEHQ